MLNRTYTCILCPNGCEMEVTIDGVTVQSVTGARCKRGRAYVEQEVAHPVRMVTTSVLVEGGKLPLCSVKLTAPIPKNAVLDAVREIQACRVTAPVHSGQVICKNVQGFGCDAIATRTVERME